MYRMIQGCIHNLFIGIAIDDQLSLYSMASLKVLTILLWDLRTKKGTSISLP